MRRIYEIVTVIIVICVCIFLTGIKIAWTQVGDEDRSGPSYSGTDDLAENHLDYWVAGSEDLLAVNTVLSLDTTRVQVGNASVKLDTDSDFLVVLSFPATRNADWDLSTQDTLHFWLYTEFVFSASDYARAKRPENFPEIRLGTREKGTFVYKPQTNLLQQSQGTWLEVNVPLTGNSEWERTIEGEPSFADIDYIEFHVAAYYHDFRVWFDGLWFTPGLPSWALPSLQAPDLDVLYIERLPRYERYNVGYDVYGRPYIINPAAKKWPDPGEPVEWIAHLANKGEQPAGPFRVQWLVDGSVVAEQPVNGLAIDEAITSSFQWNWQSGRHEISIEIDVENTVLELTNVNNQLTVGTDDLTFGFWVEEGVVDALDTTANMIGSFSCEDWLQAATMHTMNSMFKKAVYDFAPEGIRQRVRIDDIRIVPDGTLDSYKRALPKDFVPEGFLGMYRYRSLPLALEMDGRWVFPASSIPEYVNFNLLKDPSLIHELSHQIGVIDLYRMNIEADINQVDGLTYHWPNPGIMFGGDVNGYTATDYSDHTVYGLNSTYGYRRGFYGEYLFSLPDVSRIQVLSQEGLPLAEASLTFYQKNADPELLDTVAEFTGTTDAQGLFTLPNRSVYGTTTVTGHTLKDNPFGQIDIVGRNGIFLVKVEYNGVEEYVPLRITEFNLAFYRGDTAEAIIPLQTSHLFCALGDMNCDGVLDIFDLMKLINCILDQGSCAHGDLNGDGEHDIFDLMKLINKILAS